MTSLYNKSILVLVICLHVCPAMSFEFEVGGANGSWVIPKSRDHGGSQDEDHYNMWASKNRFKVDDTIHFKYTKDSVLVVTEEEYEKCRSSHPIFFSNNGDTVFKLNRPGLFYFISGVSGHCERGQKMIIKVLELDSTPPPQSSDNNTPTGGGSASKKSGAAKMIAISVPAITVFLGAAFFLLFA